MKAFGLMMKGLDIRFWEGVSCWSRALGVGSLIIHREGDGPV